jgi:hypothetical protein
MLEITADHIALLNDVDLRTLVGLLCELEVKKFGYSSVSVTWGGDQNAADGGVDVRVALASNSPIQGFVPRSSTGFQVKKPDMPARKILEEMCPDGAIRPVIQELADQAGAYILVSSIGSMSDSVRRNRHNAMAEAVAGITNVGALKMDFYDGTQLATWVRDHASLVPWVRERVGRALHGWRGYGAWAYAPDGVDGTYLLDGTTRMSIRGQASESGITTLEGIIHIRKRLHEPGGVVRLVGLSGVGKTRLVQALFDKRIGEFVLNPSLAIYTDMADEPDPPPMGLAEDVLSTGAAAVLIVDNCPPDLHRRLSELCRRSNSTLSLVTVEYDIREDQPEGTDVLELEASSIELIEKLVTKRFSTLSVTDAHTVAEFSGGNARIAIALASTVERNETIAGLNDDELFQRLFWQRNESSDSLLLAGQACSLVYSFQGEDVSDAAQAELARLGATIGKTSEELYRSVAELQRRGLVQKRGFWRAVLPPAIANRLASQALQNIPPTAIQKHLVESAPERLLASFSRRLGYLHQSDEAASLVEKWLAPDGLLGNPATLNDLGSAMFQNVAPAAPHSALSAIERIPVSSDVSPLPHTKYFDLIRSLSYDPKLFDRCANLIAGIAIMETVGINPTHKQDAFSSLFSLYLSGTHATIEQRLLVIRALLLSDDVHRRALGVIALKGSLEAWHFSSHYKFDFGAHSRDYGYCPRTNAEVSHWFSAVLSLVENLACSDEPCAPFVRKAMADKLRGIWLKAGMYDEIDRVCRAIATKQFWPDGWIAVGATLRFGSPSFTPEIRARLIAVEEILRPNDLLQKVRSVVVPNRWSLLDSDADEDIAKSMERAEAAAEALGRAVASDEQVFDAVLAELLTGGGRLWSFARGFVSACNDLDAKWGRLVHQFAATEVSSQRLEMLRGFLFALNTEKPKLVDSLLEEAVDSEPLAVVYPMLEASKEINQRGVARLLRSLALGRAPIRAYRALSGGRVAETISGSDFEKLVECIGAKAGGQEVAVEILGMRLFSERELKHDAPLEILRAGRNLLRNYEFSRHNNREEYHWGEISKLCLVGEEGTAVASEMCRKLQGSISDFATRVSFHDALLSGLFAAQPLAMLDGLLVSSSTALDMSDFSYAFGGANSPFDSVPATTLLEWCDRDPIPRYPIVASVITIFRPVDGTKPRKWTDNALEVLDRAPNRVQVLDQYVKRLSPSGWVGTYSGALELNVKLLDDFEVHPDPAVVDFVGRAKSRFRDIIEVERNRESAEDKARDERFE